MMDAVTAWPRPVRDFVASYQEREYRRLAVEMGLGNDPRAAFEQLTTGRAPFHFEKGHGMGEGPAPFEHPDLHRAMVTTFEVLQGELDALGFVKLPTPYLATLATGDVNARVIEEAKTRTKVMFFEHGIFRFLFDIAKLTAWAAPPLSETQLSDDEALARLHPKYTMPLQASQYFAATLFAYATSGSPMASATPIPEPQHNLNLSILLLNHMERFVMVHELAHLKRGHLEQAPTPAQEFEADANSLGVVTTLAQRYHGSWAIAYWASELVLVALNLLYRAVGLMAFGPCRLSWVSPTHPDPLARRDLLRGIWLEPHVPPAGVDAARGVCAMTEALFQSLWELSNWMLAIEYSKGARTAATWKNIVAYIKPTETGT